MSDSMLFGKLYLAGNNTHVQREKVVSLTTARILNIINQNPKVIKDKQTNCTKPCKSCPIEIVSDMS